MRPSELIDAALDVQSAVSNAHRRAAPVRRTRHMFYVGMSATLLLIVLIGFTPSLYLRPFFDGPNYPFYLVVHGVVLTAWYAGFFLQTALVAGHRADLHRRLGWAGAGLGVAVLAVSVMVTLRFVPRLKALGVDIESGIVGFSAIVWSDLASLLFFVVFVSMAVALRRRPEMHKRLMLLASISLIQPAAARISRWSIFAALGPGQLSIGIMLLLLVALGLHDLMVNKRLHPVTLVGGSAFFVAKLLSVLVVSSSEFGRSFVRWLALSVFG